MKTASGIIMSAPVAYPTQSEGRTLEDVEDPDRHDEHGRENMREASGHRPRVEGPRSARRRRRVPLRLDDVADQQPEAREHARPREPVAEGRDGPDQREVPAPPLVRVERDAARLVREHRRLLRVHPVLEYSHEHRDAPEHHRPPPAENADRPTESAEQEARVGEGDDEPVVPTEGLEELALLDHRARIDSLSRH